jgi:chromosome segregation and condensation protein ScpB
LLESGDRIGLASAPEPLSQAAMEVLSIVANEQPITCAEISHIRATDCSGAIETLLARGLIEDDPRFGGRGRYANGTPKAVSLWFHLRPFGHRRWLGRDRRQ